LQKRLHDSEILLDLAASDLQGLVQKAVDELVRCGKLSDRQRQAIDSTLRDRGEGELHDLGGGVGVLRVRYEAQIGDAYSCALIRVPEGVRASDHERVHYVWLNVAPCGAPTPADEDLEPFGWMLHDERSSAGERVCLGTRHGRSTETAVLHERLRRWLQHEGPRDDPVFVLCLPRPVDRASPTRFSGR